MATGDLKRNRWGEIKEVCKGSILEAFKVLQFVGSLPFPRSNESSVKIAVGENFKEIVSNSGRDAFIKFYAPWCRHCKNLHPTWEELGDQMKNESVDVIKIDVSNNEMYDSKYRVAVIPTIYWKFADTTKTPVRYNNSLELSEFIKFAAENATAELKGWDRHGKPKKKS